MKKFNTQIFLNILLACTILIGDLFYILTGVANVINIDSNLWIKSITSALFVVLGIVNLIYCINQKNSKLNFAITMVVGLTLAMLGDILLEVEFMVGAIFFALGHIGYFLAYCMLCKFKWTDLIAGGIIALASVMVILFVPVFNLSLTMKILVIVYAIVISFMVGKAVTNYIREKSIINLIILIGSILFFFSDLMLLFDNFSSLLLDGTFGILCLSTYYPAEIFLALSIVFLPKTKSKKE